MKRTALVLATALASLIAPASALATNVYVNDLSTTKQEGSAFVVGFETEPGAAVDGAVVHIVASDDDVLDFAVDHVVGSVILNSTYSQAKVTLDDRIVNVPVLHTKTLFYFTASPQVVFNRTFAKVTLEDEDARFAPSLDTARLTKKSLQFSLRTQDDDAINGQIVLRYGTKVLVSQNINNVRGEGKIVVKISASTRRKILAHGRNIDVTLTGSTEKRDVSIKQSLRLPKSVEKHV